MLVKIYSTVNDFIEFETELKDTREIFNSIKHTYGEDVTDKILYSGHVFVGIVGDRVDSLTATALISDINLYEQLHIIPAIEGEELITASMIAAAATSMGGAAAGAAVSATIVGGITVAGAIACVMNTAILIGLSMAVSAIMTPDTSFGSDPSQAQKQSKIFNTALTITEQGGSVPLTYGNPFCGGVLISSGITSTNVGAANVA
jgi:predicted phage tail protein